MTNQLVLNIQCSDQSLEGLIRPLMAYFPLTFLRRGGRKNGYYFLLRSLGVIKAQSLSVSIQFISLPLPCFARFRIPFLPFRLSLLQTFFIMDSAGSLENFVYPVRRRIPDNFKHLLERRSFRHFNWVGYGWDLTPEEQLSLKRGEVPPATYADLSLLSHLNDQWALRTFDQREARGAPEALATAQAASQTTLSDVLPADVGLLPAADPSPCTFHSTTLSSIHSRSSPSMVFNPQELSMLPGKDDWGSLLVSPAIVGPCMDTRLLMTTPEAQIASSLPDFEIDTISEGTENSGRLLPIYSPDSAPALSPSGSSTCSSEDFDLNTELFPGPLLHHQIGRAHV